MSFISEVLSSFLGFIFAILSTVILNFMYGNIKKKELLRSVFDELQQVKSDIDNNVFMINNYRENEIKLYVYYNPYSDFCWKSLVNSQGISLLKRDEEFINISKAYQLIDELNYLERIHGEICFAKKYDQLEFISEHIEFKRQNLSKYITDKFDK